MKDISIKFIPQKDQRFDKIQQIGDYFETEDSIEFRITEFENQSFSMACALHELVEKFRNDQLGIKDADVDQFDLDHPELDDPGMSQDAPYHKTHLEADAIERTFLALSGNDWAEYEKAIDALWSDE